MTDFLSSDVTFYGRDRQRSVQLQPAVMLAPMDGVTDRCFRRLVIGLGGVGGACTEFVRLSVAPASKNTIRDYLGDPQAVPVGVQFMAAEARHVAASVAHAESVGAAFIDLNFGCPAPVVVGKCAGSALLDFPQRITEIITAAVSATLLPVGAKLRAGNTSADRLEEILTAVVAGRPAFITLHARLRVQSYSDAATWEWLARARTILKRLAPDIPLVGNGSVNCGSDIQAMRLATHCDAVMVGRAALADPFIFRKAAGGVTETPQEAATFALQYADEMSTDGGNRLALGRLKQLVKWYTAGNLFAACEEQRHALLRSDMATIRAWFIARQQ